MKPLLASSIPPNTPSLIQIGRRILLLLGFVTLALISAWMWLAWKNLKNNQLQRMAVAASLAANHSQSYFDTIASNLEGLGLQLMQQNALQHPRIAETLLQEFKNRHPDLGGATLILPSGQMFASSARKTEERLPNIMEKTEWREDFLQNLQATGLSVNRPQRGYLLNKWLIPLRYTVRDARGEVRFLLQTSILLERQQALWSNLGLQHGVQIGLLREDGVMLSSWPAVDLDQNPSKANLDELARSIQQSFTNGFYQISAISWQKQREGAYQRLRAYPLYIFMSISNSTQLGFWWKNIQVPIFTILLLYGFTAMLYGFLALRFKHRMQLVQTALARGIMNSSTVLPGTGVLEIDQLCSALADTQQKLEASARTREHQLLSAADAGTFTLRMRDGMVLQANDAFLGMLGRTREEVVSRPWAALFEGGDGTDGAASGQYPSQELSLRVLRFKHKSGRPVWLSLAEFIDATQGEPLRQGLAFNVSQREELLSKVQLHSDRLRALWQLATDRDTLDIDKMRKMLRLGLDALAMQFCVLSQYVDGHMRVLYKTGRGLQFEEDQIIAMEDSLCQETMRNKSSQFIDDLATVPHYAKQPLVNAWKLRAFVSAPIWVGDTVYGTLTFYDRQLHEQPFSDEDKVFVELLAAWFGKMLLEQQQQNVLETMAMTDSLTGLPNRRAAESLLNSEAARGKRSHEGFSVVICDLDRFKLINDHFGHGIGDEVLRHVSTIMRSALREGDWVARWGGEEFIIFLHHSNGQEALHVMERLREEIKSKPVPTQHGDLSLTASFGISVFESDASELQQVLAEADVCLYEAKRSGRDRVVLGEAVGKGRLWQAGMLQHALQENRIMAAYQVMVDLKSGAVVADEALARLILPDGKIFPAAEFVEAAEGINLIHQVDEIIARNAIERYKKQHDDLLHHGAIHFINLSPQFLARRDLLDTLLEEAKSLTQSIGHNRLLDQPVVFEITERQLLDDFESMRENLKHLLDYGFRLALDDFGSGYSSFLYLAELPISYLKIEGWMIRNMQHNDRILSMVKSIVMLAQTLGMTTIAECVEDARTAEILCDMGVDWGQGYYFGHPVLDNPAEPVGKAAV